MSVDWVAVGSSILKFFTWRVLGGRHKRVAVVPGDGHYGCMYAEFRSLDLPLLFDDEHMEYLCMKICQELLEYPYKRAADTLEIVDHSDDEIEVIEPEH